MRSPPCAKYGGYAGTPFAYGSIPCNDTFRVPLKKGGIAPMKNGRTHETAQP